MAATDNPLKRLFKSFLKDFTEWLIAEPIQSIRQSDIELPVGALRTDQIFTVTLASGEEVPFHVEFEAGDDTEVMKWRMLSYLSRIAESTKQPVRSAVLYLNKKGRDDTGEHRLGSIRWSYKVIRVEEIEAREFLRSSSPAMWALSALAKRKEPEKEAFEAVDKIKKNADNKDKTKLLELFLILLHDERLVEMIQEQLEKEDYLMNSPFLQKIRAEERDEGRDERSYEIAKGMKEKGLSVELIMELTNLSADEIEQL